MMRWIALSIIAFSIPALSQADGNGAIAIPANAAIHEGVSTTVSSVNPVPFSDLTRACCGTGWRYLEVTRGTFTWPMLDGFVTQAFANNSIPMYTFQNVPFYASDISASFSGNGTTVTGTSNTPLNAAWLNSNSVTITGARPGGFNVTANITVTGTYTFTYHNATSGTSTVNGNVHNVTNAYGQPPNDIYGTGTQASPVNVACQGVLSGSTTTDCQYKEYVTALMQHECHVSSQPGTPLIGACDNRNYEMWNEFNARSWMGNYQDIAQMSQDAAVIIRLYCGDCTIISASASAGGDGYNPTGGAGAFQSATLDYLTRWAALPSASKPNAVAYHAYPTRTTVIPEPWPTSIISSSSTLCTSRNTPNASCRTALKDQTGQLISGALQNAAISSWAANLPTWNTEWGFNLNGNLADQLSVSLSGSGTVVTATSPIALPANWITGSYIEMSRAVAAGFNTTAPCTAATQITKTGANTFTYLNATAGASTTNGIAMQVSSVCITTASTWTLRQAWLAQSMIILAKAGNAHNLAYVYNDQCWMTMFGSGSHQAGCPNDPVLPNAALPTQSAFAQAMQWLTNTIVPAANTLTSTVVAGGNLWTLNVVHNGSLAQFAWFDGWQGSYTYTYPAPYVKTQDLDGNITTLRGTVVLTNRPILLY